MKSRTGLYPFLKQCIEDGKKAHFKLDKLVVDGQYYMYDPDKKKTLMVTKQDRGQSSKYRHDILAELKLCSLNIQGLKKYENNKLFSNFCSQYDIIALYETWQTGVDDFKGLMNGYTSFNKLRKCKNKENI